MERKSVRSISREHVNTRHDVLNWFGPSRGVIALRPVLMYYTIEIGSPLFLSGAFRDLSRCLLDYLRDVLRPPLDVNLSSLFIVGEPPYRI
jgi:hypothetical protein